MNQKRSWKRRKVIRRHLDIPCQCRIFLCQHRSTVRDHICCLLCSLYTPVTLSSWTGNKREGCKQKPCLYHPTSVYLFPGVLTNVSETERESKVLSLSLWKTRYIRIIALTASIWGEWVSRRCFWGGTVITFLWQPLTGGVLAEIAHMIFPPGNGQAVPGVQQQHQGALGVCREESKANSLSALGWVLGWRDVSNGGKPKKRPIGQGFAEHSVSLPRGSSLNLPVAL